MKKYIVTLVIIVSFLSLVGCGSKEIDNNELDKKLNFNNSIKLNSSNYEVNGDNINITLDFEGEVMIVGIMTQIRNAVEMEFKDKYKEIDLTIIQDEPFKSVNYIFKNNAWDKEIE